MHHQRVMFDAAPYVAGSETSREAAESMLEHLSGLRLTVWRYIRDRGEEGATCDEAEVALSLRHQTCSARFRELYQMGVIEFKGQRRSTRSGRGAEVYVLKTKG